MPAALAWLVGGVAALLALGPRRADASAPSGPSADLDALADMLITETGFVGPQPELAQIVYVALNRSRGARKSILNIVSPDARAPLWNASDKYRRRYEAARDNPRWDTARAFAAKVISGTSGYPNRGYTKFVHPGGMPTPPCSSNRVATATPYGTRCLPSWIVGGTKVGRALFA